MTDIDKLAELLASKLPCDPYPVDSFWNKRAIEERRRDMILHQLAPALIAVVQAVRPVRRGDGRLACTMCKAAWLVPSLEAHTPECPLYVLDVKLAEALGD